MNEDLYVDITCMNDHVYFMVQTWGGENRFKNLEYSLWITLSMSLVMKLSIAWSTHATKISRLGTITPAGAELNIYEHKLDFLIDNMTI